MDEVVGYVTAYLKKKGFTQTEKHELLRVLYPVFIHCFMDLMAKGHIQEDHEMMHLRDLQKLEGVISPTHPELTLNNPPNNVLTQKMEFAHSLRQSKFNIKICEHELLRVLYPVFIHCFMDLVAKGHIHEARNFFNAFREDHDMMHLRDLRKLEGVLSPTHLELTLNNPPDNVLLTQEMEFAHSLRQSKFNIKICEFYVVIMRFATSLQHELLRVLYPLFIHCLWIWWPKGIFRKVEYMCMSARNFFNAFREDHEMNAYLRDLQKLEGVLSPTHLEFQHLSISLHMVIYLGVLRHQHIVDPCSMGIITGEAILNLEDVKWAEVEGMPVVLLSCEKRMKKTIP
ncbi:TFIID subunit TAF5, NTD2 domain [Sesbania bispinosa]|nr:TFIID subunit TAF5, NTD2 domain [Sesbania bispinosa]